jgi:hypothetical protein
MSENDIPVEKVNYQAFLVRMWRSGAESPWRASVQHARSGEQIRFANMEDLLLFLYEQTMGNPEPES